VHDERGVTDADTWGKFHAMTNRSRIMVNTNTNTIDKKDGPDNDYMKMCAGKAIEHGLLNIPSGHHVVWHWDGGAHRESFASETAAAIKFGSLNTTASRLLTKDGRILRDEGPTNEWKLAAKGALVI